MATEGDNLAHTSWRDDLWLQAYGLNQITVLDYFSLSPFYDRTCSNEQARQKGLSTKQLAYVGIPSLHMRVDFYQQLSTAGLLAGGSIHT